MLHNCRHIMPNGDNCHAPTLKGKPYCYFHTRLHRFTAQPPIGVMDDLRLPVLEDRSAIQIALAQVLHALCSSRIDAKKAGLMLYALQIASQNVERKYDIIPMFGVKSVTQSETGEELAPIERTCSPDDCATCPDRDTCDDSSLKEQDDDDTEAEVEEDRP
ncbi:MAG: hypothetical protein ACLQLH_00605 [Terracidiphilus sp.]